MEKENGGLLESLSSVKERVAAALKISRRTVSSIKKRKENNSIFLSPGKHPKTTDLHDSTKMTVRDTLYDLYKEKKQVTLKEIISVGKLSIPIHLKGITKNETITWLEANNIPFDGKLLQPELLSLAKMNKKEPVYQSGLFITKYFSNRILLLSVRKGMTDRI